jgi:hypothetical protein
MMAALQAVRDALAAVDGVVTCEIGLEANLSPADYPMVRLVPSRIIAGRPYHGRECETLIYFGAPIANREGLPAVYAGLFELEGKLLAVLRAGGHRYRETITDEDRLDAYKIMALRVDIIGANAAP